MIFVIAVIVVNAILIAIGFISILGMLAVVAATIALIALLVGIGAVQSKSWKGTLLSVIVFLMAGIIAVWLQPDQPFYKTALTVLLVLFNSSVLGGFGRRIGR